MKRHDETLLWRYAARELDSEEAALTEHHLSECVDCRERLLDVRQARLVLQDAQAPRPAVQWAKVDQGISQLVEARLLAKARGSRAGWSWPVGFAGAVACAAALALAVSGGMKLDFLQPAAAPVARAPAPSTHSQVELAVGLSRVGPVLAAAAPGERLVAGAVLRTSPRGRGQLSLADGSRIRLSGGTQLALTRAEADDVAVTLERGRVGVQASHNPRRGFVVHSNGLSVRVVGTLFSVSQLAGVVEVAVAEGKVEVEPPEGAALFLAAGERVRFERGGWKPIRGTTTPSQLAELIDLSAPPLIEAAGAPRSPAAGLMPPGALARRDDTAARNGAGQRAAPGQVVGVAAIRSDEPELAELERPQPAGLLPRKAAVAQGGATVWPAPAAQLPPLEEKPSVWPTFGGGPTTYEPPSGGVSPGPEVRPVEQPKAEPAPAATPAPVPAPAPVATPAEAPASTPVAAGPAPEFTGWPKDRGATPVPASSPQPLPEDLEALFLQRAERGLERGICERYLLGLQEIAADASRNERAQQARILRARCFDARVRPDLSDVEYRRYLEIWPNGRHSDEARKALMQ